MLHADSRAPADFVKLEGFLAVAILVSLKSCEAHLSIPVQIFPELLSALVLRIPSFAWDLQRE